MPSSPHLLAAYADMKGRGRTATSEETNTSRRGAARPCRARTPGPAGGRRAGSRRARAANARCRPRGRPGSDVAGVGDDHLDVAEVVGRPPWRTRRRSSRRSRRAGAPRPRRPPRAPAPRPPRTSRCAGRRARPESPARQRQRGRRADARRGPRDHGRSAVGLVVLAHQRTVTVTGSGRSRGRWRSGPGARGRRSTSTDRTRRDQLLAAPPAPRAGRGWRRGRSAARRRS